MSNNLPLLYSRTPNNNTTYLKHNHCETKNNIYMSSVVNMSPYSTSSNVNTPIMIFTKTPNTNVDNYKSSYGFEYEHAYENSNKNILSCLKPGNILFWKKVKKDDDFMYGHVAIITSANNFEVTVAQQNRHPPIEQYNTAELVNMINREDSQILGIKVLPKNLSEYLSHKLKNIQVKHFDE